MQVQVKLLFHLRKERTDNVNVTDGSDATDLIRQLGIPIEEVGFLGINGRQATLDQQLKAGDIIHIVPFIGGG